MAQLGSVAFKFFLLPVGVALIILQLLTPSLSYDATSAKLTYKHAGSTSWSTLRGESGETWTSQQVTLVTSDDRTLKVDYLRPQGTSSAANQALTVIVAGFLPVEWLIDQIRPTGNQTVVIYRSPRLKRMLISGWFPLHQLHSAKSIGDYWTFLTSNPLTYGYNVYMGLHEAPGDIVDIVDWARSYLAIDAQRINLIGIGAGALVAAAAANKLNTIALPARTLTLVYPPADLASAIRDNATSAPRWSRPLLATVLTPLYVRLTLTDHLSRTHPTRKYLIIPRRSFELATYAAEPAISVAGPEATIDYLDVDYSSLHLEGNSYQLRQKIGTWLVAQDAIPSY